MNISIIEGGDSYTTTTTIGRTVMMMMMITQWHCGRHNAVLQPIKHEMR